MVRVGFFGCGFIARYHAMQLALSASACTVVACHDTDPASADGFAEEVAALYPDLGRPEPVGDVRSLLDSVDAVFVCTWTSTHLELVEAAVAAGVAVFCEKPLGVDLDAAEAVAAALARAPQHMVGLVLRSAPAMLVARELIADDTSGSVMNVVFRDDQYLPVGGIYGSTWRKDPSLVGTGALLEHSIHDVDILEWLVGPVGSVAAHTYSFHELGPIEDSVSAMGSFVDGGSFTLGSVWHDIAERVSQRRIEIFCENALVTIDGEFFGPVSRQDSEGTTTFDAESLTPFLQSRGIEPVSAESNFLEAVAGGSAHRLRPDAEDALRAHVLVDAMYRSAARDGESVQVAPR